MKKTCYVCGGHIRPGGNHVIIYGETARHVNCYPGSKKYMENPKLAKSYLDIFRRAGESDTQVRERIGLVATEPETCGCGEPMFTLADGKSKGCPACGEQY